MAAAKHKGVHFRERALPASLKHDRDRRDLRPIGHFRERALPASLKQVSQVALRQHHGISGSARASLKAMKLKS
jgi:hypothetical protein